MMATADELNALADLCEQMSGPNNVLNWSIARAVGWGYQTPSQANRKNPAWFHPEDCRNGEPVFDSLHGTDIWREPLQYHDSIDAAMTLIPVRFRLGTLLEFDENAGWAAKLFNRGEPGGLSSSRGATAALALCAAALRARALSDASPAASQPAPADGITSPARIEAAAGDTGAHL